MLHDVEKWRKILSDFQDAYAEFGQAWFHLHGVTFAERGDAINAGEPWTRQGELIGLVPLNEEGSGYAIVALRVGEGHGPIAEWHRQLIADGIPIVARAETALERFRELAAMAGAALPRSIRDTIPVAPHGAMAWWLATMWWSNPPSAEDLARKGFRSIWCSPFEDAIETIERCNLTSDHPSLSTNGQGEAKTEQTVEAAIFDADQGKARTHADIVEFVKNRFNREVGTRTIQNHLSDGTVRNYRQGKLYVFSISDLDTATK